ncbi:hypothetical protein H696_03773 [Fonticula alba]|uniref:Uncharacterized protein n=1 Tax=Fonticula alba TaxID=691883 RepID=A0A058Z5D3_FONAL|nr:hypothetical protein H696_03773 [Fonticula alba]KCV69341.1 hypothetical protein H696_03773 [Fonticula alba]|eukprot:XP_009495906.1 hypothetical protein H696_03773 [Fonticula alba]
MGTWPRRSTAEILASLGIRSDLSIILSEPDHLVRQSGFELSSDAVEALQLALIDEYATEPEALCPELFGRLPAGHPPDPGDSLPRQSSAVRAFMSMLDEEFCDPDPGPLVADFATKDAIPTLLPGLDKLLDGGLIGGDIVEVLGPANCGKSQLCQQVAAVAGGLATLRDVELSFATGQAPSVGAALDQLEAQPAPQPAVLFVDTGTQPSAQRMADLLFRRMGQLLHPKHPLTGGLRTMPDARRRLVQASLDRIECVRVSDVGALLVLLHQLARQHVPHPSTGSPLLLVIDSPAALLTRPHSIQLGLDAGTGAPSSLSGGTSSQAPPPSQVPHLQRALGATVNAEYSGMASSVGALLQDLALTGRFSILMTNSGYKWEHPRIGRTMRPSLGAPWRRTATTRIVMLPSPGPAHGGQDSGTRQDPVLGAITVEKSNRMAPETITNIRTPFRITLLGIEPGV